MSEIFQIYYKPEQLPLLDPLAMPFDNSAAQKPHVFEYSVIIDSYRKRPVEQDYRGFVSWKFQQKTGIPLKTWKADIEAHPGYDVYFINPFPDQVCFGNVWKQADYYHLGMTAKSQALLAANQCHLDLQSEKHDIGNTAFCNYWVGNKKFWEAYIAFIQPFYQYMLDHPQDVAVQAMMSVADKKIKASYLPFFFERLFTTFLYNNKSIKAHVYTYSKEDLLKKYKEPLADKVSELQSYFAQGKTELYEQESRALLNRLHPFPQTWNYRALRLLNRFVGGLR